MSTTALGARIEICGGIATGKTSLARLLASDGAGALVLEDFRKNPFWERFYQRPEVFVREKNICFLAQHTGELRATSLPGLVFCDYAVVQDLAYASLTGDAQHISLMDLVFQHLYSPLPAPRLIIHLMCDEQVQLSRIRARGRSEEASIGVEYLRGLNEALATVLVERPPLCQVLKVRSDVIDFVHSAEVARAIKHDILSGSI